MQNQKEKIDWLSINSIRTLSIDAVQKANSGHPGLPLGAAPFSYVLFQNHLKFNPKDPKFFDRDRFVLSAGHGSALIYSLLHTYGYDVTIDDLKNFRQLGSKTPGHPEFGHTAGVEATTGPLGQGSANAVGMAIAERKLAYLLNTPEHKMVDHYTYCLVSDGDLMEGLSGEAASIAGHLNLGKLIYLYDSNDICLDGPTSLTFTENVSKRYESYGWQVIEVANADSDLQAIDAAIIAAKKETNKPTLIVCKTTIGFGSPNKQGKAASHGSPLGTDEMALTKKALEWSHGDFLVPDDAKANFKKPGELGATAQSRWNEQFNAWKTSNPEKFKIYESGLKSTLPSNFSESLPKFKVGEDSASRESAGKVLNAIAKEVPYFFGGDADLSVSTNTAIKEGGSFDGKSGFGRNIHYGVREHAMAAIANGIAYHGGLRSYTATFFCFSDYMKPSIRLAAMNHLPVTYVFTHDSIGLGEDGPTHQPVEHLAALRAIPGLITMRPGDANETREAWNFAMTHSKGPTALVLSRQKLKTLDRTVYASEAGVHQGAYVVSDRANFKAILVATGSELNLALDVQSKLDGEGIPLRVVSMPSMELFLKQDSSYQEKVIPASCQKVASVEAASSFGWAQITGKNGLQFAVNDFGASAPAALIYEKFGITVPAISAKISQWVR
jgi:transketolase